MAFPSRFTFLARRLNPLVLPLTRRLPPLAVLHHVGRRSGRSFDTPVQAFSTAEGWVVALAYSHDAPFALNLMAAGGGEMTRGGRRYRITNPRRAGRDARRLLPSPVALQLRLLGVDDFLQFDAAPVEDRR